MLEYTLPDMTCGHCVATVKKTLQALDPAGQIEIDLPTHRVRFETALEDAAVRAALDEEGYPPAAA